MTAYIVLTPAEATAIQGASSTGHRIEPILLPNSNYGVPFNAILGTAYSDKRSQLLGKPVFDLTKPAGTIVIGSAMGDAENYAAFLRTGTRFDQKGCRIAEGSLIPATEIPNQSWGVSGAAVNGKVSIGTFIIEIRADNIAFNGWDFRGKWLLVKGHNCSFTDCLFDYQAWNAPTNGVFTIVRTMAHYLGGVTNNPTFDYCTFDGGKQNVAARGLWTDSSLGVVIRNSVFKDWGDDPFTSHGGLVEDCLFQRGGYCKGQQASNGEWYGSVHSDQFWLRMTREPLTVRRCFFDYRNPDNIPDHWEGVTWSGGSFNVGTPSGGTKLSSLNNCVRTVTAIGSFQIEHEVNVYNNVMLCDPTSKNGYLVANGNQGLGNNTGKYGVLGSNWVQPTSFTGVYYPQFLSQGTVFKDFMDLWTGVKAAPDLVV